MPRQKNLTFSPQSHTGLEFQVRPQQHSTACQHNAVDNLPKNQFGDRNKDESPAEICIHMVSVFVTITFLEQIIVNSLLIFGKILSGKNFVLFANLFESFILDLLQNRLPIYIYLSLSFAYLSCITIFTTLFALLQKASKSVVSTIRTKLFGQSIWEVFSISTFI